ncbi:MAG TPA: glutamyl-tRNA reductase [Thermodesulfobacteriota bacterium]|nr:glutamyl-tRNA reductase [Thermodesulfobacteriota bacterium]
MHNIFTLGISYKDTPVELREKLSFSGNDTERVLSEILTDTVLEECIIISTCNRIEFYAIAEDIELCSDQIKQFVCNYNKISSDKLNSHFYLYTGAQAVRHLYRVSSSLDSMVVGEPQILGQVKDAYKTATKADSTGLILNKLFHSAFFTAKKVRSETGIGSQAVSISYAAVELAKRIFDDFSERTAVLIGSGEMGELAAKNLINVGINELIIASRNINNARVLAQNLGGKAVGMEEVYYHINHADIIITATDSIDYIIKPHHLNEALGVRKNEPIFLIDIAVPRDIDPRIHDFENVYLYDIDDLAGVLEENIESRKKSAKRAEEIINERVDRFSHWIEQLKVFPAIVELKNRFELIKNLETDKALRKLENSQGDEKEIIEKMASSLISKLLHSPLSNLKKESSGYSGLIYVDAITKLFDLQTKLTLVDDESDEEPSKDWNERQ